MFEINELQINLFVIGYDYNNINTTRLNVRITNLASSGEYVPVLVDHSDELPCRGVYYLHHGLQRRIRVTVVHDKSSNLKWKDVKELVVGRIRYVTFFKA